MLFRFGVILAPDSADVQLLVLGSREEMGRWDPDRAVHMKPVHELLSPDEPNLWLGDVQLEEPVKDALWFNLNLAAQRALETPTVSYLFSTEVWKNAKELWTLTEADLACAEDEAKALKPLKAPALVMSEEHYRTAECPDVQLRSCKGSPAHDLTITFDNSVVATTNTAWNLGKGSPAHHLTITFDNSVVATTKTAWNLVPGRDIAALKANQVIT
ncbi:unnamed protein product [Pleuronectes platessa]|uniref:CBM20 domain-containing protein n=1 Tax=Pleuronectes platessa TaxID=8262 RepID=A0A9N7UID4_PLEPL|nr:unnamed protein product [Pleuronectes platessa]